MAVIAPSILTADFADLKNEIAKLESASIEWLHLDVMDGRFVPNISFGPHFVSSLRKVTKMIFDVHLMVEEPDHLIYAFAEAGADIITVHAEACRHLHRTIGLIGSFGKKKGIALNPATPVEAIKWLLGDLDLVLVMSVNPGFGGQKYIPTSTEKIAQLAALKQKNEYSYDICVDGGVNKDNVGKIIAAGCDIVVAGSFVFSAPSVSENIAVLKNAMQQG